MLDIICTRKEKKTGIFIFRDLQNGVFTISIPEKLLLQVTIPRIGHEIDFVVGRFTITLSMNTAISLIVNRSKYFDQ